MSRKEDAVPATLRSLTVVEVLASADGPASLAELTAAVRLPKPTLYRMLAMLQSASLVVREPGTRRYMIGPRLASLGRSVMLNAGLRAGRHAILSRLVEEIGESCNFTMLDGPRVVYLDRVEAEWPLRITLTPGSVVPVHCSASGKLLLALLPAVRRRRLLSHIALSRHTPNTITELGALDTELAGIRKLRYATDNEEYLAGLVCVAVPVADARGRACAAVALQAPVARMTLERALEHVGRMRRAADEIGQTLTG